MFKLLIAAILWVGLAQASLALTVEQRLVTGLQAQGYVILEQGYTFLGRLRVVAENDEVHREIVVNPGTGEILRDYAILLSNIPQSPSQSATAFSNRNSKGQRANNVSSSPRLPATAKDGSPTGIASAAVSSLAPGSATLRSASIQVDTAPNTDDILLDDSLLTLAPGIP